MMCMGPWAPKFSAVWRRDKDSPLYRSTVYFRCSCHKGAITIQQKRRLALADTLWHSPLHAP